MIKKHPIRAHAERNVLKVLEGDCETAVGVHAIIKGDEIILEAELFSLDGNAIDFMKKNLPRLKMQNYLVKKWDRY